MPIVVDPTVDHLSRTFRATNEFCATVRMFKGSIRQWTLSTAKVLTNYRCLWPPHFITFKIFTLLLRRRRYLLYGIIPEGIFWGENRNLIRFYRFRFADWWRGFMIVLWWWWYYYGTIILTEFSSILRLNHALANVSVKHQSGRTWLAISSSGQTREITARL